MARRSFFHPARKGLVWTKPYRTSATDVQHLPGEPVGDLRMFQQLSLYRRGVIGYEDDPHTAAVIATWKAKAARDGVDADVNAIEATVEEAPRRGRGRGPSGPPKGSAPTAKVHADHRTPDEPEKRG